MTPYHAAIYDKEKKTVVRFILVGIAVELIILSFMYLVGGGITIEVLAPDGKRDALSPVVVPMLVVLLGGIAEVRAQYAKLDAMEKIFHSLN